MHLLQRFLPQSLVGRVFSLYAVSLLLFVVAGLAIFYRYQFVQQMEDQQLAGEMMVNVAAQTVGEHHFDIGTEEKAMLLEGLDAIDLTLKHRDAIAAWQARDKAKRPWIYLEKPS